MEKLAISTISLHVLDYRIDAKRLEEWARSQTATSLVDFSSREGEVEGTLKDIAERACQFFVCKASQ